MRVVLQWRRARGQECSLVNIEKLAKGLKKSLLEFVPP